MTEEKLLDYLEGRLSTKEQAKVEEQLTQDVVLQGKLAEMQRLQNLMEDSPNLPTSKRLDDNFYQMLAMEERANTDEAKVVPMRHRFSREWQIAAGFLLLFSLLTSLLLMNNQQHKRELVMMEKALEQNQQMMFNLLEGESPSARIKAVNFSTQTPNTATFEVLAKVLNTDDNLNVRLAALDALSQFSDFKEVREILIEALEKQNEPITQIALIQALVQLEEKGVVPKLQELINHPMLEKPVKDEAYNGLIQLGEPI